MRLIDADKIIFFDCLAKTGNSICCHAKGIVSEDVIDAQPTVDAVPVVRCKDCKYCSVDRYADGNIPTYVCIEMDCGVEMDDFCSRGERK